MSVKTIFNCAACGKDHDDDYDAIHCCAPDENYKCGVCEKYHGGDYEAAELCCDNNENEPLKQQLEL